MKISDEAVEAAAVAVYGHQLDEGVREATTARLRKALEAAPPHMMADALEDAADDVRFSGMRRERAWLRARAGEPRGQA